MFWVDSDIGMITFVGKEWRDSGGSVQSIVVCKFPMGGSKSQLSC